MYSVLRFFLFRFDAEKIHALAMSALRLFCLIPGAKWMLRRGFTYRHPALRRNLWGLTFENPVGLAAGFDKNAGYTDELACLGFGFIEIGTVTPRAQPGNEKPRLFRLPQDQAIINRMGFNNEGAAKAAANLRNRKSKIIIGGNIGKNKDTPNENACHDYISCVQALYPYVDYFAVNVSSPNTPGLRGLQEKEPLKELLSAVKATLVSLGQAKPVLLKIAPDLSEPQLDDIIEVLKETKTDGVIAVNTTLSRDNLITEERHVASLGAGGLSGSPLTAQSTKVIRRLRQQLGPNFPIIGAGGVMNLQDAIEKLQAGADLIQVYSGFIYEGPSFVKRLLKSMING